MRLALVTTGLLFPAAMLFTAAAHAEMLGLPQQLSQFFTGDSPANAEPKDESTKPQVHRKRHASRRARHLAARHRASSSHTEHLASADETRKVARALSPWATTPAENAGPLRVATAEDYVDGVRIVSPDEYNELDAAADRVPPNVFNEIDLAAAASAGTDGRSLGGPAPSALANTEPIIWPRLLAFGLGAPLLIGLFAWPIVARCRKQDAIYFR